MQTLTEIYNNLQKDGINARIKERNQTLLIWAVSEGYTEIAKALIKAGAKLNKTNSDGNTALIRAACENRIELAQALIKAGANIDVQNEHGYSALILSKRRGNMQIYDLLIKAGANTSLSTIRGATINTTEIGAKPKKSIIAYRNQEIETKILNLLQPY